MPLTRVHLLLPEIQSQMGRDCWVLCIKHHHLFNWLHEIMETLVLQGTNHIT